MAFHPPPTPVFLDYCTLITSEHQNKFNFQFVVGWTANSMGQIVDNLIAAQGLFDLDTAPGQQLDFIGKWIGTPRRLEVPIDGVFFSWDTVDLGWDQGTWKGTHEPGTIVVNMDDTTYRRVLKSMALGNHWDGRLATLQHIYDVAVPPANSVRIRDNQDMTMTVNVFGPRLADILVAAITGPLAKLRPGGVAIDAYNFPA